MQFVAEVVTRTFVVLIKVALVLFVLWILPKAVPFLVEHTIGPGAGTTVDVHAPQSASPSISVDSSTPLPRTS